MTKITLEEDDGSQKIELNFIPLKDPETKEETGTHAMSVDFITPKEDLNNASPMFKQAFMITMKAMGYGQEVEEK